MRGRVSVGSHPTSNCFQKFESRAPAQPSQVGAPAETTRQIEYASLKHHGMAMRFNGNRKKFLANSVIIFCEQLWDWSVWKWRIFSLMPKRPTRRFGEFGS